MNDIEHLSKKVDFILDVINLTEINGIIPKELIERSRNRMKIEQLREQIKISSITEKEKLEKELKKSVAKELEFEKIKKGNFVSRLFRKI
jgi:hypothetical protein